MKNDRNMSKKIIGIDCRMSEETGIGRYIQNLLNELNKIDKVNEYILFVNSSSTLKKLGLGENFKIKIVDIPWHGFSEQTKFLYIILKERLDLYHSPQSNMPYFYPKKFFITVHDLTIIKFKTGRASTHLYVWYWLKRLVFKFFLYLSIWRAQKVITVSEFVREEICKVFPKFRFKVFCIYNGVNLTVFKANPEISSDVLRKFEINFPYLFYVGNAYPHKNLERLIAAFSIFNTENRYKLILAGKQDFFYSRLKKEYSKSKNIIFLGEVTDDELSALYTNCELFVYPSLSEGFGLQILEALNCGCKISCSGNSSFPEIGGNLLNYFDPFDINSMISSFNKSIKEEKRITKEEMQKIINKFSWKISATKHLKLYEEN